MVWASNKDTNKVLLGLQKSSLSCSLREWLSQLQVSQDKEAFLTEIVTSLSPGLNDFKNRVEKSVQEIFTEIKQVKNKMETKSPKAAEQVPNTL